MKTLLTSNITATAEMPIKQGTLNFLQAAYKETNDVLATALIGKAYNSISQWAVKGVKNVGVYPAFDISAGWIMYNGTMYQVDATAFNAGVNTAVASIVTTYQTAANADPVEFTDGNPHNVHEIKKIRFAAGVSGSGLFDYADLNFCEIEAATEVTYQSGWDKDAFESVFYRKNRDGLVSIIGRYAANGTPADTDPCFVLPAGYYPPYGTYITGIANDGSGEYPVQFFIATSGEVFVFQFGVSSYADNTVFSINGSFYNF